MQNWFSRTQLLLGPEGMEKLKNARVAVFGVGGVGGYAVEALVRSGVGSLDLIDDDVVCPSNINRQIIATTKTVGRHKVDVAEERVHEINPDCVVRTFKTFYMPETADLFDFKEYDYIIDAIDTVAGKLELIVRAQEAGTPIISSMGAGNKLDPTAFEVADLYKTSVCPLAKVMRRECKKRGIKHLKVVYSKEEPIRPREDMSVSCQENDDGTSGVERKGTERRSVPGSTAFVPSIAGLIIAGEVIKDLIDYGKDV
ncbi:MAG: tRNA threonylcarbamoyladenosine dehydratase [Clostridiales bacterium]|nr:tRNA threonylcarbamoyladenosine dehydratase [Clostridiales bacterium]